MANVQTVFGFGGVGHAACCAPAGGVGMIGNDLLMPAPLGSAGPQAFRGTLGLIVTAGQSTYPSQDGTFTIVRGTGEHWGNGLIDGYIIGGTTADGYYAMDSNDTGSGVSDQTVGRRYKVGSEYDQFVNSSSSSPEYIQFQKDQRTQEEAANPKLKAYDDALRAWGASQQPPVAVDPVFGFATGFDIAQAPQAVQNAYADFTGNPIPQAPPPPAGPAKYLQSGITFGDDGTVYDINGQGNPQGLKLSAAEVASLKSTGHLPAGDTFGQSAPTPTVPSNSPPTHTPSSSPTDTNPSSVPPVQPPTVVGPTDTPPAATTTTGGSIFDNLSSVPWYVWAGVAGVLLLSRKRS